MSRKRTDKLKLNYRRLIYFLRHDFLTLDNIVLAVAIFLCIFWTYSSINSMSRNWKLTERLSIESSNLELLKVEVAALELENEYYETEEYQELAARHLFNKKLPGENLVYLPANSATAINKHKTKTAKAAEKVYTNPEKWFNLLFPKV